MLPSAQDDLVELVRFVQDRQQTSSWARLLQEYQPERLQDVAVQAIRLAQRTTTQMFIVESLAVVHSAALKVLSSGEGESKLLYTSDSPNWHTQVNYRQHDVLTHGETRAEHRTNTEARGEEILTTASCALCFFLLRLILHSWHILLRSVE